MRRAIPRSNKGQMLRPAHRRNKQVQVVDDDGINLHEGPGEKVGLLLIIPLQSHTVTGTH